jgi:hypothetical protein
MTGAWSNLRQATAAEEVHLAAANRRVYPSARSAGCFQPTAVDPMRDLPLSKRPERAILAANRPESWERRF